MSEGRLPIQKANLVAGVLPGFQDERQPRKSTSLGHEAELSVSRVEWVPSRIGPWCDTLSRAAPRKLGGRLSSRNPGIPEEVQVVEV
jgi:hypothetical protein